MHPMEVPLVELSNSSCFAGVALVMTTARRAAPARVREVREHREGFAGLEDDISFDVQQLERAKQSKRVAARRHEGPRDG